MIDTLIMKAIVSILMVTWYHPLTYTYSVVLHGMVIESKVYQFGLLTFAEK